MFDFYDKIYVKVKHKKGGEKDLERNVLIDNKEVAFVANHFINENRVPVTMKDLYDQKNQKTDYSRVINIMVVFCPKCKQMHPIFRTYQKDGEFVYCKDDKEYDADFFFELTRKTRGYNEAPYKSVCPSCGENLDNYQFIFLEKTSVDNGSRTLKSIRIFEPKDDKLVASTFLAYYYPNTSAGKLAVLPIRHRLVFNYKTGQTYFLEGHDLRGKHPSWDTTPKILNVTVGKNAYDYPALSLIARNKTVIAELATSLLKIHGGRKEQLTKVGDFSDTSFPMLTIYNNIPFFNYNFYYMAEKKVSNCGYWEKKAVDRLTYKFRMLKKKYSENDAVIFQKYLLKGTKLTLKKAIKKELFGNPLLVDLYKFAIDLGFTNTDVLRSFMINGVSSLADCKAIIEKSDEDFKPIIKDFVKELINLKGETGAYKVLMSESKNDSLSTSAVESYIKDTALMFFMFKERNMVRNEYFKGDLKKIHDVLSRDYKKIRVENKELNYSDEIYLLNDKIDDFSFILAKDTYELIDIGQELHICVGSYGERAASGKLIIVKMIKGNEYVGCIELSPDGKSLHQAKACFNNLLEEKKAEALKAWVEKHEINTDCCGDYSHIKKGEILYDEKIIYQGHYDYANYGVYVDGDVRGLLRERNHTNNHENANNDDYMHIPDDWDDDGFENLPFI